MCAAAGFFIRLLIALFAEPVAALAHPDPHARDNAIRVVRASGFFALPALNTARYSDDPQVSDTARLLMSRLVPLTWVDATRKQWLAVGAICVPLPDNSFYTSFVNGWVEKIDGSLDVLLDVARYMQLQRDENPPAWLTPFGWWCFESNVASQLQSWRIIARDNADYYYGVAPMPRIQYTEPERD